WQTIRGGEKGEGAVGGTVARQPAVESDPDVARRILAERFRRVVTQRGQPRWTPEINHFVTVVIPTGQYPELGGDDRDPDVAPRIFEQPVGLLRCERQRNK